MSSTGSREAKASGELDRAYQRLLENSEYVKELAKIISDGLSDLATDVGAVYTGTYESGTANLLDEYKRAKANGEASNLEEFYRNKKALDKLSKYLDRASGVANIFNDIANGKNSGQIVVGAITDGILFVTTNVLKRANPIFIAIDLANMIDGLTLNTGAFDLRQKMQNLYDKIFNTTSDLPDLEMLKKGILQITLPNGEVYARPFIDTGSKFSLFGDGKDDVLFGGNGDDLLQGRSGSDLLLGGNGYDTYFTDGKDIIRDDDGKGQVYFNGLKLTDGTQIEKGSNIYKTIDNIKTRIALTTKIL